MRNRWGVELKRGHYAWATSARGDKVEGTIVAIDRTSEFALAYGARVMFDNGVSVGADDVSQVLPPMRVSRGGVVKANPGDIHIDIDSHNTKGRSVHAKNPLVRVKVGSRSMATGKAPTKRLRERRKVTAKAPAGVYANPRALRGFTIRFANVENDGGFSFGMDNTTPVTFVLSERERKGRAWYRSFRLPDALIKSPRFQLWAASHPRIIASLNQLKRMLQPFMPEK